MEDMTFWQLTSPKSQAKLAEWAEDMGYEDGEPCPISKDHRKGGGRMPLLSVVLPGRSVQDIVWTWYSECLLTDRALDVFKSGRLTGFEVKPVKAVFKRTKDPTPRLWELVVTGWAGMAPPESGVKVTWKCDGCRQYKYSGITDATKLISTKQWDGSDFFMVWPLPKFIFVTGRVVEVFRETKLSGAEFTSPHDIEADGFGPGRLSHFMPDKRARELGEPLGIY